MDQKLVANARIFFVGQLHGLLGSLQQDHPERKYQLETVGERTEIEKQVVQRDRGFKGTRWSTGCSLS